MATPEKMTIADIRKMLFNCDLYAVIGCDEYTNKEARELLFKEGNQQKNMSVINNGTHFLIY